ncbi:nicotinamide riboside transporter PnuC [Vibrio zhugei]|uniref:Nicotinamide riboside transporter PnuC n=1 Tax=Vibrio zhugei TaxID=2479546 RepID=A0ABV7C4B1_9VIBR|nr:nicotinamide riboside transporter PnuC [Vibrio zhugei]
MTVFELFDIHNTLVTIPLGSGYDMSWIEAIGTLFGLLCIWFASKEKTINYPFGLLNVTLFAIIFYQIQLYGILLLQVFFFAANVYGWYAWTRTDDNGETLSVRWMTPSKQTVVAVLSVISIALMTMYIDRFFALLANFTINTMNVFGARLTLPTLSPDAFPFWDSTLTVLSIVAQILMTRKYVENWILWVVVNVISIGVYAAQGVYALAIEYVILLFIALNGTREWVKTASSNAEANQQ